MRPLTTQDRAVLSATDGYSVRARVWVWDGAAYQDVTNLEGRDWLVEVAWDESVNEPCAQATVQLRRRQEDMTLNPLVANKLTGVLELARPFYIEVATLPLGDSPVSGDWREVFRGQIERLSLDKDPITFVGRDDAGALIRKFIETETEYGSDAGTAIQTVMQSILTGNSTGMTLFTPVSPAVLLGKYKQKKASVMAAMRERALSIGWDVRMFWDHDNQIFRFTLLGPDRTGAAGSQWTFAPGQVRAVTRLEQDVGDVRNAGRLYYYNRSALDSGGKPTRAFVDADDATSITKYGRQWMQLAEDEDSPVDSPTEAQRMLDGAIADLKEPLLDCGVETGLHYAVQLGDLLTFAADNEHFSEDQTLAVVSAAHRVGRRGHRTALTLRGLPVAAQDDWLRRESRARQQPPAYTPATVSGLTVTPTAGGALVTFTAPTSPPFPKEYELHVSTSSGFTPSSSTLRERANRTTFELTGLAPGTTYYAKVVPRTADGEQGSASSQATIAPRYVEPRTLQPYIVPGIIPNDSFEANNGPGEPDTWRLTSGTWGVTASLSSTAYSGSYALRFEGSVDNEITSQLVTAREGDVINAEAVTMRPTVGGSSAASLVVDWMSDLTTTIAQSSVLLGQGGAGSWARSIDASVAPSGTRYLRVRLVQGSGVTNPLLIDSVRVLYARFLAEDVVFILSPTGGFTALSGGATHELAGYFMSAGSEVTVIGHLFAPVSTTSAVAFNLPAGYRPRKQRTFATSTTAGTPLVVEVRADGDVYVYSAPGGSTVSFDGIRFRTD